MNRYVNCLNILSIVGLKLALKGSPPSLMFNVPPRFCQIELFRMHVAVFDTMLKLEHYKGLNSAIHSCIQIYRCLPKSKVKWLIRSNLNT